MKKYMMIKICLVSLVFFVCKAPALAQDQDIDIKCEVSGLDLNFSQEDSEYGFTFGSFSVFADGKELKGEKDVIMATKFYKLPRTKLILSIFVLHYPKDELTPYAQLSMGMILGKKRAPTLSPDLDEEKMTRGAIGIANAWYPIKAFNEGVEGRLSTAFLGKERPVHIMMQCKKVKKIGS